MLPVFILGLLLSIFIIILIALVKVTYPTSDYDVSTDYDQTIGYTPTPFSF